MITSSLTFALHILVSSYKILAPVGQLLEYVLPYRNMATKAVKGNINYNTKHLKRGDPLSPYDGKIRVYNTRYCPFAHRAILALIAKQLEFEVVNINLMEKPEWLATKSPFTKVPSLEVKENECICESLVIVEYLDEVYPQRQLLPKDPILRALDKVIVAAIDPIHAFFIKIFKSPESVTDQTVEAYHQALSFIEQQLKSRGTRFLDGNEPGYADYMIWPWFERILAVQELEDRIKIDASKYNLLTEYIDNMFKDPVVSDYLVPAHIILEFFIGYKAGNPNYDLLIEN